MGFRQFVEKNKTWFVPAFLLVAGGLLFYSFWTSAVADDMGGPVEKAYYTTDGKTYFPDSLNKLCPFDHEGKPAYRAFVFRKKPGEQPFIAYLGKHTAEASLPVATGGQSPAGIAPPKVQKADHSTEYTGPRAPDEVRRPDQANWVPAGSPEGMAIINSVVAGGQRPEPVMPE